MNVSPPGYAAARSTAERGDVMGPVGIRTAPPVDTVDPEAMFGALAEVVLTGVLTPAAASAAVTITQNERGMV